MARLRSACPLDCPDGCSLSVDVDEEAGRITWVGAAPQAADANPFTAGFICAKVKRYHERVHGPRRLGTPLVRTGPKGAGEFRRAGWDEALDLVAERITAAIEHGGPATVAPYLYNSSAGYLGANGLTPLLFRALGTSAVDHNICAATMGAAYARMYGRMDSAEPDDVSEARLVVLWGANPSVANTHLVPPLQTAAKDGAELIVVDPRRTTIARRAARHLAVRPGTDAVAAMAMARHWHHTGAIDRAFCEAHVVGLDEYLEACEPWTLDAAAAVTGVDAADLAWVAERYAEVRPALLRPGWGLERNANGGAACTAVLALPLLIGQFGSRGQGVLSSLHAGKVLDTRGLSRAVFGEGRPPAPPRTLNMNLIGAHLCDPTFTPAIDVLFIQGANPAASAPDQRLMLRGLQREDLFTVVHDQVLTDTARYADVVLPATTHFETDELIAAYGSATLERVRAVIPPVGESRTNNEVAAALAARLGLDAERFDPSPDRLIGLLGAGELAEGAHRSRPARTVQFVDTFPHHAEGRAQLHPPRYTPLDDRHPLALLTPSTHATINSVLGDVAPAAPLLRLNPADAADRGIVDGAVVRVWNDLGAIDVEARLDADLRSGVTVMPKGMWLDQLPGGLTANALVPNTLDPLAGGACFNDARVDVALAAG